MVSEARRQKLLAKRQARNRERGARAAVIAAAVLDQNGSPSSDKEHAMLDKRQIMAQARKQARDDLRIERRQRRQQQAIMQSAFLRLPAELRGLIYEHVFAERQIMIRAESSTLGSRQETEQRRNRRLQNAWALTAVCHTVRREVLQMLPPLSQMSLVFEGFGRLCRDDFDQWLSELGSDRVSRIRHLVLVGENWCVNNHLEQRKCLRTLAIDLDRRSFSLQTSPISNSSAEDLLICRCGIERERMVTTLLHRVMNGGDTGRSKVLDKALLNEVYGWVNSITPSYSITNHTKTGV